MKHYLLYILAILPTISVFGQVSDINKTTGWYMTNECFQGQVDVTQTPFSSATLELTIQSGYGAYGGAYQGYYLFCDLDNDGYNNFFRLMYKNPWPTQERGLIVHSRKGLTTEDYTVSYGLTEPRKEIVTDFNNDGIKEVLLFSQGMDTEPFPGDSIMLYHIDGDSVQYFDNVSFYHAGTVGDIDNDGDQDIITGFGYNDNNRFFRIPEVYINDGDFNFRFDNSMFINFPHNLNGWFTIELYDLNDDGYLDLLYEYYEDNIPSLNIVYNQGGIYDYEERYSIDVSKYDENGFVSDIDFYDLNNDNKTDIIINFGYEKYQSLVYLREGEEYIDKTSTYVKPSSIDDAWVIWNFLKDIDGDGDIDIVPDGSQWRYFYLENNDGIFQKVDSTPITSGYLYSRPPVTTPQVSSVSIIFPEQNSDSVDVPTTFKWNSDENATSYEIQLFTDALSTEVLNDIITDTVTTISELEFDKEYLFRVRSSNQYGVSNWSNVEFRTLEQSINTSVEEFIPTDYSLNQNYPNPFNPTTNISFSLQEGGYVTLKIFDIIGREVQTLIEGNLSSGYHSYTLDGSNLKSGIYFYTLQSSKYTITRQMTLLK